MKYCGQAYVDGKNRKHMDVSGGTVCGWRKQLGGTGDCCKQEQQHKGGWKAGLKKHDFFK